MIDAIKYLANAQMALCGVANQPRYSCVSSELYAVAICVTDQCVCFCSCHGFYVAPIPTLYAISASVPVRKLNE